MLVQLISVSKRVPGLNEFPPSPLTYSICQPTTVRLPPVEFSVQILVCPFTWVRQCSSPSGCTECKEICQGQAGINHTVTSICHLVHELKKEICHAIHSAVNSVTWTGVMFHYFIVNMCENIKSLKFHSLISWYWLDDYVTRQTEAQTKMAIILQMAFSIASCWKFFATLLKFHRNLFK